MILDDLAYANRLRGAHPAEKAGLAALCMLASLLARCPWVPLLGVALCSFWALALARIPLRSWARICALPLGFLVLGGFSLALEFRGGRLTLDPDGLRTALRVTARSLGCTSAMLLLAATTPLTDLIQLLRLLRTPPLVLEMLTISYRALFILLDTSGQMYRAQASRLGYSSFRLSLRSLGHLVSQLFSRALLRAELAWRALLSRGYGESLCVLPPSYRIAPGRATAAGVLGVALLGLAILLPGGRP
nr:cobalt ECF transporter T component CbiQ [uncultured Holophaga sp.]